MEAYVNGVKVGSLSGTYNLTKANVIPEIGGGYRSYLNGSIANVQIYNTALTPQEIQYLYQQGLGGGPVRLQNLVGCGLLTEMQKIIAVMIIMEQSMEE